jgi:uncharacterized protein YyaL (SSP411 family)
LRLVAVLTLAGSALCAQAWEHENSKVGFVEYREGIIESLKDKGRPYFLLFSAEWCFWCHQFGENTLTDDKVASYLNAHYTNIFIDADIHSAAYLKYRATGLPYTVFLNPDTSPHFRYAGTVYADDFLTVIKQVKTNVQQGLSVEGHDATDYRYTPPEKFQPGGLEELGSGFRQGVLESFDSAERGLGKGEKALYPRTFLYLMSEGTAESKAQAAAAIRKTVDRAIERIYDPVEGGFFRYAETRDWKVPHYEKMADLNAGVVLLLYRLNEVAPDASLVAAADKTLGYLRSTLYDAKAGVFLSFQAADEHYYTIRSMQDRRKAEVPRVSTKVFVDRLALTAGHLLEVLAYRADGGLESQLARSVDFVGRGVMSSGALGRYYMLDTGKWSGKATLQDHALVARMFLAASRRLQAPRYRELAKKVVDQAIARFHDEKVGVLADPSLGDTDDAEFLMEMNGLLAQVMLDLDQANGYGRRVDDIVRYFSGMGEILEERLWDGENWEFSERYVPYLRAALERVARRSAALQAR